MELIASLRQTAVGIYNQQHQTKLIDAVFKRLIAGIENKKPTGQKCRTCLSVMHTVANLVVPAKATIIETLSSLQGKTALALVSNPENTQDLMILTALTVVCLIDDHDYHLVQSDHYSPVSRDGLVSLLSGNHISVGLDIRIDLDNISRKVIQVKNETTVGEFVVSQTDDKLRHQFRDVAQQEGVFWLFICVNGRDQDLPLMGTSR
jgi:hypothetical protein